MFVLVLNQSNIIPDGQNNKLRYRFPNSVNLKDKYIAVSSISMYYSWDNITALQLNNKITYTWTVAATSTTYTITIPDGLYEISEINYFCQFTLISNGHYWISATGDNLYPFEIVVNPTRYAIQLNTYLVPILPLTGGITVPSNWGGYATQTYNSVVSFPAKFNEVVGYPATFSSNPNVNNAGVAVTTPANNYETKNAAGTFSYLSNSSPQVQPNNNVLLSLSGINNPYSQPSSIIYSLNPAVGAGQQISERPPNFMWNKIIDGMYNELLLTFLGTNLNPLIIKDPNMTILLTIRDKDESFMTSK
jgi:hypothetical protein